MVPVFRAPMRPRVRDVAGAAWGLAHGLVGIGDADERRIGRFAAVPDGAFLWTRDEDGAFWLGRVDGPCREADAAAAATAGFTHVRPARWLDRPVPDPEVPEAVRATFARGGRNLQRTRDAGAERVSASLWAGG